MRDSRDIACCMLVLGSAEVPRRCWPSCSLSCWRCIDALPWMPFTGGSRSWGIRNCEKSWGLGHPVRMTMGPRFWIIFNLNRPIFSVQSTCAGRSLAFLFCLALNTSLIVLLEILGTGNIKSNMPRYSAQIRQYRDRQKQMPVFRRTFPASDNPLNINNRIQKGATARYTSGYGVGSFPARVRPEKVEETLLSFFSVTGVEWC